LAVQVRPAQAQTGTSSDVININIPDNPLVATMSETGTEPTVAFNTNLSFGTASSSPGTDITLPGVFTVLLLDPPNEPTQPGETRIIISLPSGGTAALSDAVINTAGNTQVPPQLLFLSDPNPDLQVVATNLANATNPTFLTETGSAQNISANLGTLTAFGSPQVLFTSDVETPEPASLTLLAAGAAGMLLMTRRRAAAKPKCG
jgi:hypothetical protein